MTYKNSLDRISEWVCEHRLSSFSIGLLFFVLSIAGLKLLHLDNDYRSFIGDENTALQVSDWFSERQNTPGESLILIYEPADGDLFTPTSMIQYAELMRIAPSWPGVISIEGLLDQEKLVRVELPDGNQKYKSSGILEGKNIFDQESLSRLRDELLSLPTITGRYVGDSGKNAAIILFLDFDESDRSKSEVVGELKEQVSNAEVVLADLSPGDKLHLAGTVLFEYEAFAVLRNDVRALFPIALALIAGVIFLVYRSGIFVPLALMIVLLPVVGTAGIAGWMGLPLSNLSVSALLLVGTLAVADVMHVSNTFFASRRQGEKISSALSKAVKSNIAIILATTLTTSFGQIALLSSAAEPVRVMGLVIIIGAVTALIYATLMLPLALSLEKKVPSGAFEKPISSYLGQCAAYGFARPYTVIGGFASVMILAVVGLLKTEVSDSLQGWFHEDTDFYRTMNVLDENYLGADTLTIAIEAKSDDLIAARNYTPDSPEIDEYRQLHTELDRYFSNGYWFTPISTAKASNHLFDNGFIDQPLYGSDTFEAIGTFSTETAARSGLMTRYEPGKKDYSIWYFDSNSDSSFDIVREADEIGKILGTNTGERQFKIGGIGLALSQLSAENFWSIAKGSGFTFILISALMFVIFRSSYLGTISLLPNLAPILVALGFWGLFKGHINLAAVTVFSVSLGIVVDDTIHILMKYKAELKKYQDDHEQAFIAAVQQAGVGIFVTTVVLSCGFLLLSMSSFLLTAQKSFLVGVAIIFAFVFDVLALPAIIKVTSRTKLAKMAL